MWTIAILFLLLLLAIGLSFLLIVVLKIYSWSVSKSMHFKGIKKQEGQPFKCGWSAVLLPLMWSCVRPGFPAGTQGGALPWVGSRCEVGQSQGWRAPERKPPQHACWGDIWTRMEPSRTHLPKTPHWTWAYFFLCNNPHHHYHFQALCARHCSKCCAYINSFERVPKAASKWFEAYAMMSGSLQGVKSRHSWVTLLMKVFSSKKRKENHI